MQSKFLKSPQQFPLISHHHHKAFRRVISCAKNSSSENKNGLKILGKTFDDYKLSLNNLDSSKYAFFLL